MNEVLTQIEINTSEVIKASNFDGAFYCGGEEGTKEKHTGIVLLDIVSKKVLKKSDVKIKHWTCTKCNIEFFFR